jgi:ABC-type nitrate/sulfonate/bicarbonate transport system substrate-binding protein
MLLSDLLRRVLGCGLLVAFLILPQAGRAQDAGSTTLRIATTANDGGMEAYYAQELGLFKKAGINAEITAIGNGANIVTGVIGGTYDVGVAASVSVVSAYQSGLPILLV